MLRILPNLLLTETTTKSRHQDTVLDMGHYFPRRSILKISCNIFYIICFNEEGVHVDIRTPRLKEFNFIADKKSFGDHLNIISISCKH